MKRTIIVAPLLALTITACGSASNSKASEKAGEQSAANLIKTFSSVEYMSDPEIAATVKDWLGGHDRQPGAPARPPDSAEADIIAADTIAYADELQKAKQLVHASQLQAELTPTVPTLTKFIRTSGAKTQRAFLADQGVQATIGKQVGCGTMTDLFAAYSSQSQIQQARKAAGCS